MSDIQPELYSDDGLTVTIRAGEQEGRLGRIDPMDVGDPDSVARLLAELGPLTGAKGSEEFVIDSIKRPSEDSERRFTIAYRQAVNGVPVGSSREIVLSSDGVVQSLRSTLVDPSELPDISNRMSEDAALESAIRALELEYGAAGGFEYTHIADKATFAYRLMDAQWLPIWRSVFTVTSNDSSGTFWVTVNVLTNETTITSSSI